MLIFHIVANVVSLCFWFWCDTCSALVSNANLQWGNPSQKTYPMVPWGCRFSTRRCILHHFSHGYFYVYLPPIFMCLLSLVLMYLSKQDLLFDCICVFSLTKNTWPQERLHREVLCTHAAVREREWCTFTLSMYTFVTCNGRKSYI